MDQWANDMMLVMGLGFNSTWVLYFSGKYYFHNNYICQLSCFLHIKYLSRYEFPRDLRRGKSSQMVKGFHRGWGGVTECPERMLMAPKAYRQSEGKPEVPIHG